MTPFLPIGALASTPAWHGWALLKRRLFTLTGGYRMGWFSASPLLTRLESLWNTGALLGLFFDPHCRQYHHHRCAGWRVGGVVLGGAAGVAGVIKPVTVGDAGWDRIFGNKEKQDGEATQEEICTDV